jgi:quinol monooxygenase YgiN
MPVTVLADLHIRPEAVEQTLDGLREIMPESRAYDGCIGLEVVQDQADPGHVMLVEQWESPDHHKVYVAWRTETGTLASLAEVLTKEPTFTYFDQRSDI